MLFLSVTITQPNDLPVLSFVLLIAYIFHSTWNTGVSNLLHLKELNWKLTNISLQHLLRYGMDTFTVTSWGSCILGRQVQDYWCRQSTCTLSYSFEKCPAHSSVPFSGFEIILTKKSSQQTIVVTCSYTACFSSSCKHQAAASKEQWNRPLHLGILNCRAAELDLASVQLCLGSDHLWGVRCLFLNKSLIISLFKAARVHQTGYCIRDISILMVHHRRKRHSENTEQWQVLIGLFSRLKAILLTRYTAAEDNYF